MQAPSVDELLKSNVVLQALEDAWRDSKPDQPMGRHEEGGWIYFHHSTNEFHVRRAAAGEKSGIDLAVPPTVADAYVVATFHTHPHPAAEGWSPGPSPNDTRLSNKFGVPGFIRAENGIHVTGPERRRGGLSGGLGFPD